ncbi:cytochrome c oxidase assembly protein [Priestia megaterium]|nr:cytochrome c oxidase assembly protein [Priestia megaterium]
MNIHNHSHYGHEAHSVHIAEFIPQLLLALPFAAALVLYIFAAVSSRRYKPWPLYRTFFWCLGIICALAAVAGPIAHRVHTDFTVHMISHLLLGMLAPLLLVLGAPLTLVLRTLNVNLARRLSYILRSRFVRIPSHPVTAALLNVGGLWLLYTTDLYEAMHRNMLFHLFIHIHVFLAGYLFTASLIYMDPMPHRVSYLYRASVLWIALAGHGILSKYVYNQPPAGVPKAQAEAGGMLMYYGGDVIDMALIFILCLQWFRAARPRALVHEPAKS